MFSSIKHVLFPPVCRRCDASMDSDILLCDECLLGLEFGQRFAVNKAYLLNSSMDFLYRRTRESQKLIESLCIVALSKFSWKFGSIHACAKFYYLEKRLQKLVTEHHGKVLFIMKRDSDPILLFEPRDNDYIILI